jgi:hypothetical protein
VKTAMTAAKRNFWKSISIERKYKIEVFLDTDNVRLTDFYLIGSL